MVGHKFAYYHNIIISILTYNHWRHSHRGRQYLIAGSPVVLSVCECIQSCAWRHSASSGLLEASSYHEPRYCCTSLSGSPYLASPGSHYKAIIYLLHLDINSQSHTPAAHLEFRRVRDLAQNRYGINHKQLSTLIQLLLYERSNFQAVSSSRHYCSKKHHKCVRYRRPQKELIKLKLDYTKDLKLRQYKVHMHLHFNIESFL